jgi:Ca2+/Na+ antiporter
MAALTLLAIAVVMAGFFLWWRGRVTVTAGLGVVAVAALVAVVVFLIGAPHPAAN